MGLKLKTFEPGTFIEINDVMKGFRKLGRVTESGSMYFDDGSKTATPFPIYEALDPVAVGNTLSWGLELADQNPAQHREYVELQERLVNTGLDTFTVARVLYWAYRNRVFDYARALVGGKAATAEVSDSRVMMDRIITKAATA
ncbi:MAG: hypothetical protein K2X12_02910 [Burkholderiaceae bacterium]|jgi:hypothetical protein|nr:hypothetical protein [Burkholderiaceae bacterium]